MILSEIASTTAQVLVILPGRFQPFHKGHKAVYDYLTSKYDNVYIATSDKVDPPRSPFSFEEKKKMMELTGMDTTNVVLTKSPYQAMEITQNFDPENTILMFAVSEKDMAEDPRFGFKPKKDGSPSYFQAARDGNLETMDKHGYIMTVPTFNFDVLGKPMKSATEVRSSFANMDSQTKKQLINDLFGNYSDEVFGIMSKITESAQYGSHPSRVFGGLDGDVRHATEELEALFAKIQSAPQGTKVRRHFIIKLHNTMNVLKQQMKQGNLEFRENKNMASQKLGVFAKGKSKVSLWEHDGKIVLIDQGSKRLQESKSSVKEAVNLLYDKGYVCESVEITSLMNAAGAIMKVFFDTVKNTTTVRDKEGGSRTYNAKGDKVIAALQQKGFQQQEDDSGGLSLEPMEPKGSGMAKTMQGFV